jgi:hypothetical protein
MLRRHPDTLRWRQALPPLFVSSLIGLLIVSIFVPFAVWLLLGDVFFYFLVLLLAGTHAALKYRKPFLLPGLPLAISAMHISWGSGFLWSMLSSSNNKNG